MALSDMNESRSDPRNNRTRWTLSDLRYLEQHYCTRPLAELADHLGRSPGAVALMADRLNCRRQKSLPWTDAEMDIIRQHYGSGVGAEFLQALLPGRSVPAIFSMAEKMGVLSGRFWLEEELDILCAYYPDEGTAITARLPGRTVNAVRVMAKRLGLRKSAVSISGFRPWIEEEWQRLQDNMHLSITEQQWTLFADRTARAVEKARERLKRKQRGLR